MRVCRNAGYREEYSPGKLIQFVHSCLANAFSRTPTPAIIATNTTKLGYVPFAFPAPLLPLLVLPRRVSFPLCPLDVASTLASTVAAPMACVTVVIANVAVLMGVEGLLRKTRAKPGAGTFTWQVFALWSQGIVWTLSLPRSRPSDANWPPNV